MSLFSFENHRKYVFRKSTFGMIVLAGLCGVLFCGCAANTVYTSLLGAQTDTSIQLLDDRYLGILHDELAITDDDSVNRVHSEFHIYNRTEHALTVDLSGPEGSYTLVLEPKRDKIWLVNPGTYHVEVSVPGFPTTAADSLTIMLDKTYKWELWKTQH